MKSKTTRPSLLPVHKRLPVEVWERILSYLYPSQLSRISIVNKNLHAIVSSLEVWPRMFSAAYGTKAQLRPLLGIPRSKSYMIFLCSSSLHICEMCFSLTGYKADNLSKLPLPIPVLMPRQSTAEITYVGEKFDPNWTIRMCLSCRQDHIAKFEEPFPRIAEKSRLTAYELRNQYPSADQVPELNHIGRKSSIDEVTVIKHMRRYFGGDVGIKAFSESTEVLDEKTETRIRWYQLQD